MNIQYIRNKYHQIPELFWIPCDLPNDKAKKETDIPYVVYETRPIAINIKGNNFILLTELSHIASSIKKSETILELKEDWDEEGALPTNIETFVKAVKFIIDYSTFILKGKEKVVIDSPDIDILRDGAIIVNWETPVASFTIIFEKEPSEIYYYYAKEKQSLITLKYGININKEVNEYTTLWMANNLKYNLPNHSH